MSLKKIFAKNLKELRKRNKMTQEQLAELVNVAPRHISFIETGRSFPSCELLERICNALHVDYMELFEYTDNYSREQLLQNMQYAMHNLSNEQLKYLIKVAKELRILGR